MIPNQWYVILESNEVKPGKPVGVTRMAKSSSCGATTKARSAAWPTCVRIGAWP
jgi:hypothetical protein